jgi:ribosomal protein S18 acetylase RimI-like enzyme
MDIDVEIRAANPDEMDAVRELFREYERRIGVDLCFQGFEEEVAGLPGAYAHPDGGIWLAIRTDRPIGCIALKPFGPGVCEMKRLFVRQEATGAGIGRALAERCVSEAREREFHTMLLDTLDSMAAAQSLYRSLGFREREAYYANPLPGVVYMEKPLAGR